MSHVTASNEVISNKVEFGNLTVFTFGTVSIRVEWVDMYLNSTWVSTYFHRVRV